MAQVVTKPETFTWVINNFTKLKTKWLYSDVFFAIGYKWRLLVYPKGTISDDLSLHMQALGTANLPSNRGIDVELSLTLVNQILEKYSIVKEERFRFTAEHSHWGFTEFVPLAELHDSGYLVNDALIIKTNVFLDHKPWESKKIPMALRPNASVDSFPRTWKHEIAALRGSMAAETASSSTSCQSPELSNQRRALKDYLALSLEDIHQANAFDEIEKTTLVLLQHSTNSREKTILMDLVSRLAEFKEIVPATKSRLKNVMDPKMSISKKKSDVRERSYEQLNSLEVKFSKLSEEEREIEAQIMKLTSLKEELLVRKKTMALKLEKINVQVSRDVAEWIDIGKEAEQAASNWIQAREELAQANLSWQLFKRNLELCEKLVAY